MYQDDSEAKNDNSHKKVKSLDNHMQNNKKIKNKILQKASKVSWHKSILKYTP